MNDVTKQVVRPSLPPQDGTTLQSPEPAALGLSLTPEEIAELAKSLDPSLLALLALC